MSDIAERVKKIVVEHLGVDAEKVTENASFIDDLGADSLDTVELVMAFEEEFGCEIPDDAAETILTVGDAIKFLVRTFRTTDGEESWDFGDGSPPEIAHSDGNVAIHAKDGYAQTVHRFTNPKSRNVTEPSGWKR